MAMMATSIPVASVTTSKLVVDSDIDLSTYTLKAAKVQSSEIQADYVDELTLSGGLALGLASAGAVAVKNDFSVSGAVSGNGFSGFMVRKYTGNAGTEIYQIFIPGTVHAEWVGTTKTASGLRIRIPDTGLPLANLKMKALIKTGNDYYAANVKVYKNGVEGSAYANTNSSTPKWVNFSENVAVEAGDYLDFYLYNNNASTTSTLYAIAIIGDVTTAGGLIDESETPAGMT